MKTIYINEYHKIGIYKQYILTFHSCKHLTLDKHKSTFSLFSQLLVLTLFPLNYLTSDHFQLTDFLPRFYEVLLNVKMRNCF